MFWYVTIIFQTSSFIHWFTDKMAAILQTIFPKLIENCYILNQISLALVPKGPTTNMPVLIPIMTWRRTGDISRHHDDHIWVPYDDHIWVPYVSGTGVWNIKIYKTATSLWTNGKAALILSLKVVFLLAKRLPTRSHVKWYRFESLNKDRLKIKVKYYKRVGNIV